MSENKIFSGVDVKLLTFDHSITASCDTPINLKDILEKSLFNKSLNENCIMINIEKDISRYNNTINEFQKITLKNFVHLKATYWKERSKFVNDLNYIIQFLSQFNKDINPHNTISINHFSEVNDPNIYIQDGPLACYCSHLRSMIYGYLNFKDYTIIVEDDILIKNTHNIEQFLKCIPNDWDIVFFGSAPKNVSYNTHFYKFVDEFHSGHFYIINNKCLPFLFSKMYPITDQVDVLISNQFKQLNMYNITNTVYQRDISTNTQNNLHTIFNSPHYWVIRMEINKIQFILSEFINSELPNNRSNNTHLISLLLFDIVFHHICYINSSTDFDSDNSQFNNIDEINKNPLLSELHKSFLYLLKCTEKGDNITNMALGLLNNIINTIRQFSSHNHPFQDQIIKAYRYGSTAKIYLSNNHQFIVKSYFNQTRWKTNNHSNINDIFTKELHLLKIYSKISHTIKLLDFNIDAKYFILSYAGESLYDHFHLPINWKEQIINIFNQLTLNHIFYPEFNIKNILILNNIITFVDFGLASYNPYADNYFNCQVFIELLDILNQRLSNNCDDVLSKYLLYTVFINNIKLHKIDKFLNNIF